jgi:hypothetical protein
MPCGASQMEDPYLSMHVVVSHFLCPQRTRPLHLHRALAQMANTAETRNTLRSAGAVELFVVLLEPGTSPDVGDATACAGQCTLRHG